MLSRFPHSSKAWQSMAANLLSRSAIDSLNLAQFSANDWSSGSRASLARTVKQTNRFWNSLYTFVILALREPPWIPPISIFSNLENSITVLNNHSISFNRLRKASKRVKTALGLKVQGDACGFIAGMSFLASNCLRNSSNTSAKNNFSLVLLFEKGRREFEPRHICTR